MSDRVIIEILAALTGSISAILLLARYIIKSIDGNVDRLIAVQKEIARLDRELLTVTQSRIERSIQDIPCVQSVQSLRRAKKNNRDEKPQPRQSA